MGLPWALVGAWAFPPLWFSDVASDAQLDVQIAPDIP